MGTRHAGEASFSDNDLVYVSDEDEPSGEVYLRANLGTTTPPGLSRPRRITCDTSTETHPVLSPDGTKVAYASNAGGAWRVWVAWLYSLSEDDAPPPPLPCADMPRVKVADGPGADLWPTWLGDDIVAFSRSGAAPLDPLGDLYAVRIGDRDDEDPIGSAVRLTDGSAAETQPRALHTGDREEEDGTVPEYAVVFTSTQFRTDGSLAGIAGLSQTRIWSPSADLTVARRSHPGH